MNEAMRKSHKIVYKHPASSGPFFDGRIIFLWLGHSASLYNSVIFEGATLVYRPDCNAEGGCHAIGTRAKRGRYLLWQAP